MKNGIHLFFLQIESISPSLGSEPPSVTCPPPEPSELIWVRVEGGLSSSQILQLQVQHASCLIAWPLPCPALWRACGICTKWAKTRRQAPFQRRLDLNLFWTHLRHITLQKYPHQSPSTCLSYNVTVTLSN